MLLRKRKRIKIQEIKMEIQMYLKLRRKGKAHALNAGYLAIISTSARVQATREILGEAQEGDSSKLEEAHANNSEKAATAEATATEAEAQVNEDEAVNNGKIVRPQAKTQ